MIHQKDARILQLLQEDGRMPWVELGEKVSLSASACQRRVQAMIERGVIERIGAHINPRALGYEIEAFFRRTEPLGWGSWLELAGWGMERVGKISPQIIVLRRSR